MLVSIIIPTFNRAEYITETVQSALAQTYKETEIIIVDNCSTDNSWEIITQLKEKHPKLNIIQQKQNVGAIENWRTAINEAKGELIKILWSDDLIDKDFLSETLPLFTDQVAFVYTSVKYFGGKSQVDHFQERSGTYPIEKFLAARSFGLSVPVSPGCAIFRADILKNCLIDNIPNSLGIDLKQKAVGTDLLFFLMSATRYKKYAFLNKELSFFREHESSITTNEGTSIKYLYYFSEVFALKTLKYDYLSAVTATKIFLATTLGSNPYKLSVKDYFPDFSYQQLKFKFIIVKSWAKIRKTLAKIYGH